MRVLSKLTWGCDLSSSHQEIPRAMSDWGSGVRSRSERRPHRSTALEENDMTATYTFDVFSSLDGYGAHNGNWGGYWGKQGPELLERRLAVYDQEQRMVYGANTYRAHAQQL